MVDERMVPLDHEDSNFRLVSELFFEKALSEQLIEQEQLHPYRLDDSADHGTLAYQKALEAFGGRFDVAFLGVGEDSHVGALFPNHHSWNNEADFFFVMDDSPKPPPERMTSSRRLLARSGALFALFFGEGKRQALERYLDPQLSGSQCPVKLINDVANAFVLTDQLID